MFFTYSYMIEIFLHISKNFWTRIRFETQIKYKRVKFGSNLQISNIQTLPIPDECINTQQLNIKPYLSIVQTTEQKRG